MLQVKDNFVQVLSNVLDTDVSIMEEAERKTHAPTKIVAQIEKLTNKLSTVVNANFSINITTPNVAVFISKIPASPFAMNVQENEGNTVLTNSPEGVVTYCNRTKRNNSNNDNKNNSINDDNSSNVLGKIFIPCSTFGNTTGVFFFLSS